MASLRMRVVLGPVSRLRQLPTASAHGTKFHAGPRSQQIRGKHISRPCRARLSAVPKTVDNKTRAADSILSLLSPGVLRLNLGASLESELMELGQAHGPLAVYNHLASSCIGNAGKSVLRDDTAQRQAMAALQQIWEGAKKYRVEEQKYYKETLPAWEKDVERQRADFDARMEAKKKNAEKAAAAKGEDKMMEFGDEGSEVKTVDIAEEFVPPPVPTMPRPQPGGIFLHGEVGVGKSMLVDLFFDFCAEVIVGQESARRVHYHEFVHELHTKLAQARNKEERDTGAMARELHASGLRLLCIDEFQITNISDALVIETFLSELCRRCGIIVLLTSNRPPEQLYKEGVNGHLAIPQFLEMLSDMQFVVHDISTHNFRDLRVAESAMADLSEEQWAVGLDGPSSDKHLADAFRRLTGVDHGETTLVPITWGRKHHVAEHHNGVARFRFEDLCGSPLSSDDYLALAHHFHTFVVSGVPRFKVSQHNEARRFTNLVDVLYEQNTRFVCSSEDEPENLLQAIEGLLSVGLAQLAKDAQSPAAGESWKPGGTIGWEGNPWRRKDPFAKELDLEDAIKFANKQISAGDDASGNMVGIAGVLAPAVASLQESGFASRRAVSRMRHMRSVEYLEVHRRRYLQ
eukprot:gnl/MRDRNA2_/MRDRNA2_116556_c0_seq1.p1 gnl/MRDRNA2_/MRDRNA2_116556_c0~~gnl/MRDRNA2_/MRDRNA2_116556_c0_seq1.p1  ORF type:complete len:632 (+),score=143.70 gnl/MRDRNA2_/MRDRNA2_116556_c0_seq1:66-1961(+)